MLKCNAPDVTFHICISNSCHFWRCDMIFPPWLGFCLSFCIFFMSCISSHAIMCISFAFVFISCIQSFSPLSVSQSDTPTCTRCTPQISFRERKKNILIMGRDLSSGLGTSPVGRLSNLVPFGGHLMPQRLTALAAGPISPCSPAPLHNSPLAHLNPLHALHRWITIVMAKTAPQ